MRVPARTDEERVRMRGRGVLTSLQPSQIRAPAVHNLHNVPIHKQQAQMV